MSVKIQRAVRPSMPAKALLTGPTGAGKTWTALSMMRVLVGPEGSILVLDTEHGSALTYADQFVFDHGPFHAPFDPTDLVTTLMEQEANYDGIIVDSLSHFWTGTGGTLDIADGKFNGWKGARPIQNRLQDVLIALRCHVIYTVRSKMEYAMEQGSDGKTSVTRVGLSPVQDSTLPYDMNVVFDLDMEHRLTVSKSRTTAVPVGRIYPTGYQEQAAEQYGEWLAGGVPPADAETVLELVAWMNQVLDEKERTAVKHRFVAEVGVPHTLTANAVQEARAWLEANVGAQGGATSNGHAPPPTTEPEPDEATTGADSAAEATPEQEARQHITATVDAMRAAEVRAEAAAHGVSDKGPHKEVRARLKTAMLNAWRDNVQQAFEDPAPDPDAQYDGGGERDEAQLIQEHHDAIAAEFAE